MYPYKITATITKPGGTPIEWTHYSKTKLTREQCEKRLSVAMVIGRKTAESVTISDFQCTPNDAIVRHHEKTSGIIPNS